MVGSVTASGMHCDAFKLGLLARVCTLRRVLYLFPGTKIIAHVCLWHTVSVRMPSSPKLSLPVARARRRPHFPGGRRKGQTSPIAIFIFLGAAEAKRYFFPHCSQAQSESYVKGTEYFGYRQVNKSRPQYLNPILEGKINAKTG